jgi:2-keto-4-pentenoate hydratase
VVSAVDHEQIAQALELARTTATTIPPIAGAHPAFTCDDAYEVGRRVAAIRQAGGSLVRGVKIGLTYVPTWERLGIDAPYWAPMYDESIEQSGRVSAAGLASPRVEAEVVVGVRSPLAHGATVAEVEDAISWVSLGFEVVDSHYPEWRASVPDLIADQGCHAGLRLGPRVEFDDLREMALRTLRVELSCDAAVIAAGCGADVLGGPVQSIARCLALPNAPRIEAGEIISTGSLTGRSHPVVAGETWRITPVGSELFPGFELSVE